MWTEIASKRVFSSDVSGSRTHLSIASFVVIKGKCSLGEHIEAGGWERGGSTHSISSLLNFSFQWQFAWKQTTRKSQTNRQLSCLAPLFKTFTASLCRQEATCYLFILSLFLIKLIKRQDFCYTLLPIVVSGNQ